MKQYSYSKNVPFQDLVTGEGYICVYNPTLFFLYKDGRIALPKNTHSWYKSAPPSWYEILPEDFWPLIGTQKTQEKQDVKYCDCSMDQILRGGCKCGGI